MNRKPTSQEVIKAFDDLELKPGATWEEVREQYRLLSSVWHPDRVSEKHKDKAGDKLKAINNSRDILKTYFDKYQNDSDYDFTESRSAKEENARAAQEEAEKRARAQDEARRRQAQEEKQKAAEEADRQRQEQQAETRSSQFEEEFNAAGDLAQQVLDQEKYAPYTVGTLKIFGIFCLGLGLNLWIFNMRYDSEKDFKPYKSAEYEAYHKVDMDYYVDKANYLKKNIDKNYKFFEPKELHPPFEKSYMQILSKYRKAKERQNYQPPPVRKIDPPPQLTIKEKKALSNLESWYMNYEKVKARRDILASMKSALDRALNNANSYEYKQVKSVQFNVNIEFNSADRRLTELSESIRNVENHFNQKYGTKVKLPKRPGPQTPFQINSEGAYNNLRNSYPHLFR